MADFDKKCKIERNELLGRYTVAAVDLKAGETILLESPVLILPTNGEQRCANCLNLASNICNKCRIFTLCTDCKQHNAYDCQLCVGMTDLKVDYLQQHITDVYGPLKCLLLRENEETQTYYDELMQMEAHLKERRDTDIWQECSKNVVKPILASGITNYLKNGTQIDEDLLQRYCGIFDTNNFEIRAPDQGTLRGTYMKGGLLMHSCIANAAMAVDANYQMKIYTNQNVAKGVMLNICYTNVLWGTEERRQQLKTGKHFHCLCSRCEDPTELGSHMSSILCSPCTTAKREGGFMIKNQLTNKWHCLVCDNVLQPEFVDGILERVKEETFHAKDDLYRYEMLLMKLSRFLHANHYLMFDIKQNIAAQLRAIIMNLAHRPGRKVYERKVRLCQELLAVLQIIQPGISRMKAIVLYEWSNSLAELSRLCFGENDDVFGKVELLNLLQQSENMLRESIRMLLYEPVDTPEGQLAKNMLKELKDLQNDMKLVRE